MLFGTTTTTTTRVVRGGMPKQKKRRKNLAVTSAGASATGPVSSSSLYSQSGPMAQPYTAGAGPLANGHADAAYHPAFSSFSAPAMTPTYALPGLTSFVPPMNGQYQTSAQTPLTPHFASQVPGLLTAGNSDLEKLERLKREILEGQNPIYKAVPQPNFLESLYLGRSSQTQSIVPAHPEQIVAQAPPAQEVTLAQIPEGDNKSSEEDQPATAEDGKTNEVETVKEVTDDNVRVLYSHYGSDIHPKFLYQSIPDTSTIEPQSTPPTQKALGSIIMDEIARFRASTTSQPANSYASSVTHTNTNGSVDPLRHHNHQDIKPSIHNISDYKTAGHGGANGSAVDYSRRPDTFVSDDHNTRRPSEHWDPRQHGSRFDHENNAQRGVRDHEDRSDQRYNDSRYENYGSSDRQPPISDVRAQHAHPDDRVDSRSPVVPVVPGHVSETVRSLTERLAHGVGTDAFSLLKPGATTATQATAHYPPAGSPVSAKPSAFGPTDDYHTRSASGEDRQRLTLDDRSQSFMTNDRARQPPLDDRPHHYPPLTTGGSPATPGSHTIHSPGSLRGRATPLEERIGSKVPLEERISSPSSEAKARALQERITDPQVHSGYDRPLPPSASYRSAPHGSPHDARPSSERPRRSVDENNMIVTPVHAQGRPDERLHQRMPVYGTYSHDTQDAGPAPVASYHRVEAQDRRPPDVRVAEKEPTVVYERPTYRERDGGPPDDRARPSLDSREWRERAVYPPPPPARGGPTTPEVERYASHAPNSREWTPNERGYRASETNWDAQRSPPREADRGRYPDVRGEYERPPAAVPPRSWDRSDAPITRTRPPPEIYPPPATLERERYPPVPPEYYDNPRVRARSPSPIRRGGAPVDDLRPVKRARDEGSFYDDRRPMAYPGPDYASRPPSPPPPAGYYEGSRASYPPPREVREPHPPPYAARGDDYYARRPNDSIPPPPRNVPPANYPGRAVYSRPDRDDRRYTMPPPRTA